MKTQKFEASEFTCPSCPFLNEGTTVCSLKVCANFIDVKAENKDDLQDLSVTPYLLEV